MSRAESLATRQPGARPPAQPCEDCGEPATRETADGVWLCEGDFEALLDAAIWTGSLEQHA